MTARTLRRFTCDRCGHITEADGSAGYPRGWGTATLAGGPIGVSLKDVDLCARCADLYARFISGDPLAPDTAYRGQQP